MSEFYAAKLNDNNSVVQVIVIPDMGSDDAKITDYCNGIGLEGKWIHTSETDGSRGGFAGPGMIYDAELDEFVAPEPVEEVVE